MPRRGSDSRSRSRRRTPPRKRRHESRSESRDRSRTRRQRRSPPRRRSTPRKRSPSRRRSPSPKPSRSISGHRSPLPGRTLPKPEPTAQNNVGKAEVVDGTPLNTGDPTWQGQILVPRMGQDGINHSGNVRTICFRGPSRITKEQAEEDAAQFSKASEDGPQAVRDVAKQLQKTKKGRS
mmetsp:Transcript_44404/g.117824  ORF Transcript_44404/g.117824 Transcript_44404/m.117824 type:complete len:179 (-) Transcript_44404:145-681(-)